MYISTSHAPFILHLIVEIPATFAFALVPSGTLTRAQPHAHAVIRQYSLLLLSSNIIAVAFIINDTRPECDQSFLEAFVSLALGVYHLGPMMRAYGRVRNGKSHKASLFTHPGLHLIAHALCATLFTLKVAWLT